MPRTMTSTASGKAVQELRLAPLLEKLSSQSGMPNPAGKTERQAPAECRRRPKDPTPGDQAERGRDDDEPALRPAQPGLLDTHRQAAAAWPSSAAASSSLSVPSICSRRGFCATRVRPRARAPSAQRSPCAVRPSARRTGSDTAKTHATPPIANATRKNNAVRFHASASRSSSCPRSVATSAASSAAARPRSSP